MPNILHDRSALVARHFLAQRQRPAELININVTDLLPYQRALLVCDGTITSLIEALTLEPITVDLHQQSIVPASVAHACLLKISPTTTVMRRRVIIRGSESGQAYAYAESLLIPDRLPIGFLTALRENPRGLGSALCGAMVNNRRELLWFGRINALNWPGDLSPPLPMTTRTYQLVIDNHPAILISEHFVW